LNRGEEEIGVACGYDNAWRMHGGPNAFMRVDD